MRKEFEMTEAQMAAIIQACQPVPYIVAGGRGPMSQQESANNAWARLGEVMGFDSTTVRPVVGKSSRIFTADETPAATPTWKALAEKAIVVLNRHIVPGGLSDKDALTELYGIFDGPEYRAIVEAECAA